MKNQELEKRCYICRTDIIPGINYGAILKIAGKMFHQIESLTKRRPYIRSAYFKREKIFFDYFWSHLNQKNFRDRQRRIKFFGCAIELIKYSKLKPIFEIKNELQKENLYRFLGKIHEHYFIVQIKEDLKRKQRFLLSIFEYM
ncbi:MAG: hypothetical protein V1908_01980 [Candidatus Peregrinibacteria bacterium]